MGQRLAQGKQGHLQSVNEHGEPENDEHETDCGIRQALHGLTQSRELEDRDDHQKRNKIA